MMKCLPVRGDDPLAARQTGYKGFSHISATSVVRQLADVDPVGRFAVLQLTEPSRQQPGVSVAGEKNPANRILFRHFQHKRDARAVRRLVVLYRASPGHLAEGGFSP